METPNNNEEAIVPKKKRELNLSSSIIVGAIIIAAAIFVTQGEAAPSGEGGSKFDLVSQITEADFVRGGEKADITIIEYADFSCSFCAKYHPTLQKIVAESEGKIRWVYRHLPIFNMDAAVASQCVGNLAGDNAFWNFADTMYQNREKYGAEYYKILALAEGIDSAAYDACITDPIVKSKIQRDFSQAKILLGLDATPYSIVIDKSGQEFSFAGALPYEDVKSVLDGLSK